MTLVARIPQAQAYFLPLVYVQAQQITLWRVKFSQDPDLPPSLSHDRLHEGGDFAEGLQSLGLAGARPFMLIFNDGRIVFEDHIGNDVNRIFWLSRT